MLIAKNHITTAKQDKHFLNNCATHKTIFCAIQRQNVDHPNKNQHHLPGQRNSV